MNLRRFSVTDTSVIMSPCDQEEERLKEWEYDTLIAHGCGYPMTPGMCLYLCPLCRNEAFLRCFCLCMTDYAALISVKGSNWSVIGVWSKGLWICTDSGSNSGFGPGGVMTEKSAAVSRYGCFSVFSYNFLCLFCVFFAFLLLFFLFCVCFLCFFAFFIYFLCVCIFWSYY